MGAVDSMVEVYVYENNQLLEHLEEMLLDSEKSDKLNKAQIDEIFRVMHTIKGSSAMMGYEGLTKLSHGMEDMFSALRQNLDTPKELYELIFDLVLECIDFFKNEIGKIQEGLLPDGEVGALHDRAVALLNKLSGAEAAPVAAKPIEIIMPGDAKPMPEAAPVAAAPVASAPAGNGACEKGAKRYRAVMRFMPGCSMESVRAFAVVNSLEGLYTRIGHEPADLSLNCDEYIVNNGLTLYIESREGTTELQQHLEGTMFLQSLEFDEISASDSVPVKMKGVAQEEAAAKGEPEPAEAPAATQTFVATEPVPAPTPVQAAAAMQTDAAKPAEEKPAAQAAGSAQHGSVAQTFLSVNVSKVDKLMNLVGEIVTSESMVTRNPEIEDLHLESFEKQARRLRQLTDELQDVVMSIRMVPISSTFRKMQRIVRDMCKKTGKDAELVLIGEQTEVDKNVAENLSDPLMHMIRNSMDHGIETREERIAAGKPPVGTITLEARNTGGDVIILVSDDGHGLDRKKILKKARERGLVKRPDNEITDREAFNLIMAPGFSTNDQVTEFSGRGVGMDVVCSNVEHIGGTVSIESEMGKGMTTTLHIPLTLAIINGMDVQVGEEHYIIPILNIKESFEPKHYDIFREPGGVETIMIRGKCYPIKRIYRMFGVKGANEDLKEGIMVLVESEYGNVCLHVDKIVGEQQAVIKPVPPYIVKVAGRLKHISGCTVLGNGSISLILDINSFSNTAK